jgi:putative oxidoreductase
VKGRGPWRRSSDSLRHNIVQVAGNLDNKATRTKAIKTRENPTQGISLRLLQLYRVNGATYEQDYFMPDQSPTDGPRSALLLRLMAGGVFFWEGLLKFVHTNQGVGSFTRLMIPFPHLTATFIGGLEIVGGLLLLAGSTTRLIAIPFVAKMIVAILSTKISLYLGTSPLPLPAAPPQVGFWAVLHEIRSEYAQLLTVMFLMVTGPGKWSWDAVLNARKASVSVPVSSGTPLNLARASSR